MGRRTGPFNRRLAVNGNLSGRLGNGLIREVVQYDRPFRPLVPPPTTEQLR